MKYFEQKPTSNQRQELLPVRWALSLLILLLFSDPSQAGAQNLLKGTISTKGTVSTGYHPLIRPLFKVKFVGPAKPVNQTVLEFPCTVEWGLWLPKNTMGGGDFYYIKQKNESGVGIFDMSLSSDSSDWYWENSNKGTKGDVKNTKVLIWVTKHERFTGEDITTLAKGLKNDAVFFLNSMDLILGRPVSADESSFTLLQKDYVVQPYSEARLPDDLEWEVRGINGAPVGTTPPTAESVGKATIPGGMPTPPRIDTLPPLIFTLQAPDARGLPPPSTVTLWANTNPGTVDIHSTYDRGKATILPPYLHLNYPLTLLITAEGCDDIRKQFGSFYELRDWLIRQSTPYTVPLYKKGTSPGSDAMGPPPPSAGTGGLTPGGATPATVVKPAVIGSTPVPVSELKVIVVKDVPLPDGAIGYGLVAQQKIQVTGFPGFPSIDLITDAKGYVATTDLAPVNVKGFKMLLNGTYVDVPTDMMRRYGVNQDTVFLRLSPPASPPENLLFKPLVRSTALEGAKFTFEFYDQEPAAGVGPVVTSPPTAPNKMMGVKLSKSSFTKGVWVSLKCDKSEKVQTSDIRKFESFDEMKTAVPRSGILDFEVKLKSEFRTQGRLVLVDPASSWLSFVTVRDAVGGWLKTIPTKEEVGKSPQVWHVGYWGDTSFLNLPANDVERLKEAIGEFGSRTSNRSMINPTVIRDLAESLSTGKKEGGMQEGSLENFADTVLTERKNADSLHVILVIPHNPAVLDIDEITDAAASTFRQRLADAGVRLSIVEVGSETGLTTYQRLSQGGAAPKDVVQFYPIGAAFSAGGEELAKLVTAKLDLLTSNPPTTITP